MKTLKFRRFSIAILYKNQYFVIVKRSLLIDISLKIYQSKFKNFNKNIREIIQLVT